MFTSRCVRVACFFFLCGSAAAAQVTWRVSVDSAGNEGDEGSFDPSLSADGRYVAFSSQANDLVPSDGNELADVFVHDRRTGVTERVSVSSSGDEGDLWSYAPSISADGRFVAFVSFATNLVANDTNGRLDVFVHDRETKTTSRISGASGPEPNRDSERPSISADGRYVAFESWADNLISGDVGGFYDIFVFDREQGVTTRISETPSGEGGNWHSRRPVISGDGTKVSFSTRSDNLVASDTNDVTDVFVSDWHSGVITRVSVDSLGQEVDGISEDSSLSFHGEQVAFWGCSDDLVDDDSNHQPDIFVHDLPTGITTRVSVRSNGTEAAHHQSRLPAISWDGQRVVFSSEGRLGEEEDTNRVLDVFLHDRTTARTTRVSVSTSGLQGDLWSSEPSISGDGRLIAFRSQATNFVQNDTNGATDVFVHGPSLILESNGDEWSSGDPLTLDTWTGGASQLALLAVVAIDQTPMFDPILFGTFDPNGLWSLGVTVPPGLAGLEIDVQTVGFTPQDDLDLSNVRSLTFL